MGNILAFLSRYSKFLLFIFLEAISFYLVASYNRTQRSTVLSWGQEFSGRMYGAYNYVNYYFHLKQANDSLLAENARLKAMLPQSKYIDTFKNQSVNDTVHQQRFVYIPGYVVNNSVTSRNNYLTLAVGSQHGVDRHMGVVSTAGVVGITENVTPHYTSVISILHRDFTVSGEIAENGEKGSIVWNGQDPEIVILKDIPMHIKIQKGQHVVTSPYSKVFPEGTPVGTIVNYEVKPGDAFYTIYVRLSANLRNVRQVYVISNLLKQEQEKAEEGQVQE